MQEILFCTLSDIALHSSEYHLRVVRISLYPPKGLSDHLVDDTPITRR